MNSFQVIDQFCPEAVAVRQSALDSGFNTWRPNRGEVGSSVYEGMNFKGWHAPMLQALACVVGARVLPNSMFFRVAKPDTEAAYVHSDRGDGDWTCVAYLSDHAELFGTGFYKHRKTGLHEMPALEDMHGKPEFDELKADMINGGDKAWHQTGFVHGEFNRAVIFRAPLFHARVPRHGLGDSDDSARMVWVCHFVMIHQPSNGSQGVALPLTT